MHPIEHFCCQNDSCADFGIRGKGNLSFRGLRGGRKTYSYDLLSDM